MLNVTALGIRRSERWLFRGLSFSLSTGEALQIFGENGSGKTSLLRCLCGLLSEAEGKVEWDETIQPIFLGHLAAVKTELSVYENLALHPIGAKFPSEDRILKAIIDVNLATYEEEPAHRLSAGQLRRVALARLLLADSKCWILDEPFTSLDVDGCSWLEQLISKFIKNGGTVIFTSHQPINLGTQPLQITLDKNKLWEGDE
jgi:heme exporter protein A